MIQVGPDDRQSNYPGDMSSMPARSAHRAAQPWANNQINPSATSVPCLFPAGTTPGSSSVPGTLDSATHTFLAVHFSCPFLESGSGARRRGGQLILPVSPAGGTRSRFVVLQLFLRARFYLCAYGSGFFHKHGSGMLWQR